METEPTIDRVLPRVPYESISAASVDYFRQYVSRNTGRLVVIVAIIIFCFVSYYSTSARFDFTDLWFFLWVPALLAVAWFAYIHGKGSRLFFEGIAKAWGWTFLDSCPVTWFQGALVQVGHSHRIRSVLFDDIRNPKRVVGNLKYTIGSGKSACNYSGTFAMVTVHSVLPHILLAVDADRFDTQILWQARHLQAVRLEHVFEQRVGLYVESHLEIEALQLFDHSVLEQLLNTWSTYSFEFKGQHIYVHAPQTVDTREKMEALSALLKYLLGLVPKLQSIEGSVKAMQGAKSKKL